MSMNNSEKPPPPHIVTILRQPRMPLLYVAATIFVVNSLQRREYRIHYIISLPQYRIRAPEFLVATPLRRHTTSYATEFIVETYIRDTSLRTTSHARYHQLTSPYTTLMPYNIVIGLFTLLLRQKLLHAFIVRFHYDGSLTQIREPLEIAAVMPLALFRLRFATPSIFRCHAAAA